MISRRALSLFFALAVSVLGACDGKWSFPEGLEEVSHWTLASQAQHIYNMESDEDQVVLSLPSQWTLLLDNLNTTSYLANDTEHESSENGTRIFMFRDYLTLPKSLIQDTFNEATEGWLKRQKRIEQVFYNTDGADAKSPIGTAFAFSPPNPDALSISNTSILLEYASRAFLKSLSQQQDSKSRKRRQASQVLFEDENGVRSPGVKKEIDLRSFLVSQGAMGAMSCDLHDEVLPCDPSVKYRTYSGFCNNLRNPGWGKSVITFDRMLPAAYADGVSQPRSTSVTGKPLPSPRSISSYVHIDVSHLSQKHTLMFMQYAQFLDHDITLTPVHKGPENKILNCRECDSYASTHPECWPIKVPEGDSWYPAKRESGTPYCIPFTRSLPGQQRLGPREQINQNSAYLDSSQIYGEEVCKANSLRIRGGKLNATASEGRKALMPQTGNLRECKSPSGYCFHAGDPRASEQPALAALHTIFLRQHNAWADELKAINPGWNDEKIYQEVRRVMIAVNQHITFNELLPRLLGPSMVNAYGLALQAEGYYAGYDASCAATIYNEFATAAFRFGHSLIRPNLARMNDRYHGMTPHLQLRDGFFNSDMLYQPLMVDEVVRGLIAEPMEEMDPFVSNEITNHLFEDKRRSFSGLDLISLNIQRGRDHGLPGYNHYRGVCNLKKAQNWQDLSAEIPQDVLQRLQNMYAHVDDIDIFTGSLVERPVKGGILGPVMTCIIGSQFRKLRQCDRYWYETNDKELRFTPQQLAEIRKISLAKVVCDNMETHTDIQRWTMDAPHNVLNPRVPCNRLARINLQAWKDNGAARSPQVSQPLPLVSPAERPAPPPSGGRRSCSIGGQSVRVGGSALQSPCVSCVCTAQGTKCTSLRIINCSRLFQEVARNEILRDPVCTSQCGFHIAPSVSGPSRFATFG